MKLARSFVRALQPLLPRARPGGVTLLAYHLVGAGSDSPVDLPEEIFHRQMRELAATARVLPLAQALAEPADEKPTVVVSFDDAYANFYERAWPLLRELGLPATLFVPVGFIEGKCPAPIGGVAGLGPVSWAQLAEMVASGLLTIGSHSWSHPDLRTLDSGTARRELADSRRRLEEELGTPVEAFCYPRGLWSARVEPWVGEVYRWAVIGGGRQTRCESLRPLRIERISLRRDMPAELAPLLAARVWIEEWLADLWRRKGRN